ncbi:hypothetical protein [Variovorax sp. HJSM1_2]|uniref:hypothetical protein n=1 Tax=Variovorax sp. HJSM1_2 TaxID=3366263 RepID=UPI003BBE7A07
MSTASDRAAIRRASQQARNAMRKLDAEGAAELLQIYQAAADQVRAAIRRAASAGDTVPQHHLRPLLAQIDELVTAMGAQRDALIAQQLDNAATLGVRPYTLQGVAATGRDAQAVLTSETAMRVHAAAVDTVRNFVAADGLRLSDRLWRLDQGAREALSRAITNAVVQGWDASRAAADLAYGGQAVPAQVAGRLAASRSGALVRLGDLLAGQDGSEVWKAERVLRTEINRAHGEAYMQGGEGTPGFAGWRYLLSPQHPKPDICDLLAAQNLYGLGPGVYPTRAACPWPAHPNTLSFVEMVFESEVTDADRAGKETVTDAMGRMPPDVRVGILGEEKAALWSEGKISQGMVRSPLYRVKERLARQRR